LATIGRIDLTELPLNPPNNLRPRTARPGIFSPSDNLDQLSVDPRHNRIAFKIHEINKFKETSNFWRPCLMRTVGSTSINGSPASETCLSPFFELATAK
jgi:hypothetical protein